MFHEIVPKRVDNVHPFGTAGEGTLLGCADFYLNTKTQKFNIHEHPNRLLMVFMSNRLQMGACWMCLVAVEIFEKR